jgi:endonuclease/exonuclease/phosphatase family metal-dependent hydrolase
MIELRVLCWNLFHGRDAPPDPALKRTAWRLSGRPIDNGVYLQVNRSLEQEFTAVIAAAQWAVCLLQEAPPAWARPLASRSAAQSLRSLTSRNQLAPLTRLIGRWRPDLIGSWEGGSNTTLVRPPWQIVPGSDRTLLLSPLRERRLRERRRMSFVRLRLAAPDRPGVELCVANLHATERSRGLAERQIRRAAETATAWANGAPLVLGGDFNLRPASSSVFEELEGDFGLAPATAPDAIDHLLARGLELVEPPARWPGARRELEVPWQGGTRLIRLSDHAPLEAVFGLAGPD